MKIFYKLILIVLFTFDLIDLSVSLNINVTEITNGDKNLCDFKNELIKFLPLENEEESFIVNLYNNYIIKLMKLKSNIENINLNSNKLYGVLNSVTNKPFIAVNITRGAKNGIFLINENNYEEMLNKNYFCFLDENNNTVNISNEKSYFYLPIINYNYINIQNSTTNKNLEKILLSIFNSNNLVNYKFIDSLNLYNTYAEFYNDPCYDLNINKLSLDNFISIEARKEVYLNLFSKCNTNYCSFDSYFSSAGYLKCKCDFSINESVKSYNTKFIYNTKNINFNLFTCINAFYFYPNFKNNYLHLIIYILLIITCMTSIIFYLYEYKYIQNYIKKVLSKKVDSIIIEELKNGKLVINNFQKSKECPPKSVIMEVKDNDFDLSEDIIEEIENQNTDINNGSNLIEQLRKANELDNKKDNKNIKKKAEQKKIKEEKKSEKEKAKIETKIFITNLTNKKYVPLTFNFKTFENYVSHDRRTYPYFLLFIFFEKIFILNIFTVKNKLNPITLRIMLNIFIINIIIFLLAISTGNYFLEANKISVGSIFISFMFSYIIYELLNFFFYLIFSELKIKKKRYIKKYENSIKTYTLILLIISVFTFIISAYYLFIFSYVYIKYQKYILIELLIILGLFIAFQVIFILALGFLRHLSLRFKNEILYKINKILFYFI